jgi:hypothetical protein
MPHNVIARLASTTAVALVLAAATVAAHGDMAAAASTGAWQKRSQLVWDADTGKLVRKAFVAWDSAPELGLEFVWEGNGAPDGVINGEGRLVWRDKGAPAYDVTAVYSDYRGAVKNGRPDGDGRLKLRNGLVYEGDWRDGTMEGEGRLRFANGEAFEGGFADGAPDGAGRLTTLDGRVWNSVWRDGEEIEREPADGAVQLAQAGTVAVNVYLDGKLNDEFRAAQDEDGFDRYTYAVDDSSGVLRIQLASDEIMNLWKGDAPIMATLRQGWSDHFEDATQFGPVFVVVDIANEENQTAEVVGAYLDIDESMSDLQPYIDAYGPADGCNGRLQPEFSLMNAGWGPVENAKLTYAFGTEAEPGNQTFVAEIGSFEDAAAPSIAGGLEALGIDINRLQNDNFQCVSEDQFAACLADWQGSDLLAGLQGATFSDGNAQLLTRMWGILEYEWTDAKGGRNPRQSAVVIDFPVLDVGFGPECGAGGPVERGFPTAKLPLDQTNVRIPINYTDTIAPREQKRFGLNFVADKSSRHQFRFVIELADGRTIASPDIDLTYFVPRSPAMN